ASRRERRVRRADFSALSVDSARCLLYQACAGRICLAVAALLPHHPGMDGQTVIITGAAAGIGRALALELARRGAHVVVSARTDAAAAPVLDEITRAGGKAESLPMDVASPDSIRAAVTRFLDSHGKLDVLVNNAGVWAGKRTVTPEGFETTWSVNVLAPFRLAQLLDGALKAGTGKVINLSSVQHYKGDIHWDDLQL